MKARVKDWQEHQHYKDRSPPWIKLHRSLLDDYKFHCLPVASRAIAPLLWLLASDNSGIVNTDPDFLAFRLRMTPEEADAAVKPLIQKGWLELVADDSAALAPCNQTACLETETETETDIEPNGSSVEQSSPAVFAIPLTRGKTHDITAHDIRQYRKTFPAVDVEQSFRTMLAWLDANPKKKSGSARGAKARITSWLSRDQDRAAMAPKNPAAETDYWLRGAV